MSKFQARVAIRYFARLDLSLSLVGQTAQVCSIELDLEVKQLMGLEFVAKRFPENWQVNRIVITN